VPGGRNDYERNNKQVQPTTVCPNTAPAQGGSPGVAPNQTRVGEKAATTSTHNLQEHAEEAA